MTRITGPGVAVPGGTNAAPHGSGWRSGLRGGAGGLPLEAAARPAGQGDGRRAGRQEAGAGPAGSRPQGNAPATAGGDGERWRLFIAVPVTGPAAGTLQAWMAAGRRQRPGLKWVEPHHLHVTLRFLGERPAAEVPALVAAGARVAGAAAPVEAEIRGVGGFPDIGRARTVWAGVAAGAAELAGMAAGLERELLAVAPDLDPVTQPFRAHVTLARVRGGWIDLTAWPHAAGARDRVWGRLVVREMVLFRSQLRPGGPVYTPLHRWGLGSRD
ncbi:2'-5' RNA ligase [Thermaerobacter marianensis DSM 12885]|uniref:RNA 2',3'-cyclic phosphodiesterase n=1 Tax=Thermaerobacter marianensis (strain ATCC 700841 / DSM 12885 / JCM 10246 / 7p75a) TaxID=644966 RepID=E6SK35_THEM7|nr:RNA 2',3'-cyclic phosphodiesterase [Thermaerobacter marianensis]ADU51176.1 2'-5' RNA ligase [Thermaerobacter marianensis DSM 12885]